jgi:hypothetical protein
LANAEIIFEQLELEGYSRIEQMVINQQEENLFLDFKLKADPTTPNLSNDDRKNYAKALSGFSNTSGGVVVWGVDASKNEDNVDAARELRPISQLKVFLNNLNSLLSSSLIPLNPGVKNIAINLPNEVGKGFIVTYVPESSLPPHRAMLKLNQYFTRSGDSFVMMEHVHLEDMFGKRQKPRLELKYEIVSGGIFGGGQQWTEYVCNIVFSIKNVGKYVATYPTLRIKPKKNLKIPLNTILPMEPLYQSLKETQENGYMFAGGLNDVIHPGSSKTFATFQTETRIKELFFVKPDLEPKPSFSFEFEIFAEGCQSISDEITIPFEIIKEAIYS